MHVPVAILGAGPAGCAAALTLRRYLPELAVVVLSGPPASGPDSPTVGETLSPGAVPLLEYLGVREAFLRSGHLPAGGTASAWGSPHPAERNYIFSGRRAGWHLDRARFDAWLLAQAQAAGAQALPLRARHAKRAAGKWSITLEDGSDITAEWVVDATGRMGWLARQFQPSPQRDDSLIARVRWYQHDAAETSAAGALIEAVEDGWWYSASLPGQRGVAMFMTDADLRDRAAWDDRLAAAPCTRDRLAAWRAAGNTAVRAAGSQQRGTVSGDGWVAAGDAAAAFDPVSSLGIGFALRSGMQAARVVAAGAATAAEQAAYSESVAAIYADYRARLRQIYRREARWPRSSFWQRRHQ